jgi:putative membrane protein
MWNPMVAGQVFIKCDKTKVILPGISSPIPHFVYLFPIMGIFIRLLISMLSLGLAARLIPGIHVDGWTTLLFAAILMSVVNAIVKPLFLLLTLPITLVTLGAFLLVVNAAMLGLVAWLLPGFSITGFFPALFGWLVMSVTGWVLNSLGKNFQD